MNNIEIFTEIYETCKWGNNTNSMYKGSSGGGSEPIINITTYVPFLKDFIANKCIVSVVDLGCGDFKVGKDIYDDLKYVKYYGYDAYADVIAYNKLNNQDTKYNFTHLDFYSNKEQIYSGDLCILKDVLQHWKNEDIYYFLDYLVSSKKFKYILICNCCKQRFDDEDIIKTGDWRELSAECNPLKKYNPKILYKYSSKQVCLIDIKC